LVSVLERHAIVRSADRTAILWEDWSLRAVQLADRL
jgi:hypothetical protein